ncbi:DUF4235 domain-containing protein [Planomonospora alba]|uniref:DUF4235 domain-containing protein n=1 Tax=Planomonospora alba TaxID=161354 RepID=A0ABP6P725_9ACTN
MSDTLISRSVGLVGGMAGGLVAGAIFKQIWKFASGKEEAPQATSEEYGWGEVLVAAAIQGAIYGMVKAAIDRSTVHGAPKGRGR